MTGSIYLQHTSDVTPARFAALTREVARGIARLERDEICCGDLTLQQFETLRVLRGEGPLTVGAVAKRLGIDLSTASRNLARLAARAYLLRRRGRDDAREVRFTLTRKGGACLDALACDEETAFESLLARLPPDRRAAVGEALELLAVALAAEAASGASVCCRPGACDAPRRPPDE